MFFAPGCKVAGADINNISLHLSKKTDRHRFSFVPLVSFVVENPFNSVVPSWFNPLWFPVKLFETITDLTDPAQAERLRVRRYGVIETTNGELTRIVLRPWPKLWSLRELALVGPRWRPKGPTDRCRLYFNQPHGHESFLALRYVAATPGTSYATFRAALSVLDAIAAIKGTDALVCDAANHRLSERFLKRMGWEAHAPRWGHRNYIRRFYGNFPPAALELAGLSGST